MKRFLAFASEGFDQMVKLADFKSSHDVLADARRAVDTRQPDGFNVHESGAVLDTKTGEIRDWRATLTPFGDDHWYAPRQIGEV